MSRIFIKEVYLDKDKNKFNDKRLFKRFLNFPYILFKNDKMFVPPLYMDEKNTFSLEKNPALEWCDFRIFLAFDDTDKLLGRVCAIINKKPTTYGKENI